MDDMMPTSLNGSLDVADHTDDGALPSINERLGELRIMFKLAAKFRATVFQGSSCIIKCHIVDTLFNLQNDNGNVSLVPCAFF